MAAHTPVYWPTMGRDGIVSWETARTLHQQRELYAQRVQELQKENHEIIEEMRSRQQPLMAQMYPGQILNYNTMCIETQMCSPTPKKKDIKSLIAYYYNRK